MSLTNRHGMIYYSFVNVAQRKEFTIDRKYFLLTNRTMDNFSHFSALTLVGFFNAGFSQLPIKPFVIPENTELVELLTGGTVFFEHAGSRQAFSRGTSFWHLSGEKTIWDTLPEAPYRCAVFRFRTSEKKRLHPRVSHWRGSDRALEEFLQFSRSWYENAPEDPGLFFYTLSQLSAHASAPPEAVCSADACPLSIPENSGLYQAVRFLENNYSSHPDISRLCRISGLNRNRLFKEFNQFFKKTPNAFILEKRISLAKKLLETTTLPIKEISGQCGFENLEVFYRTFKKYTQTSPGAYRKAGTSYF